ncbi:MAG: TolC family protein, partial [Bacteroidota bacterium]|nr:TolC family protein [Bacteroidota bacterium]MDX5430734.1 TolC family protein [Bacteroidota bacterium]MDX5469481.1 TolC family protein [Bacteroidota bacterium]
MRTNSLLLLFSLCPLLLGAQVNLSLKQSSDSLLEKNYAIRLLKLDEQMADVNNTAGAAGTLPTLGLIGGLQQSTFNTRQEFFNGDVREANAALSQSRNLGLRMDWVLFNGFLVQQTRSILRLASEWAKANTIITLENELYQLASLYFEIQANERILMAMDSSLHFGKLRVQLAEKQLALGKGNRLEWVQSSIELQEDSAMYLRLKSETSILKRNLLRSAGMEGNGEIHLSDSLAADKLWVFQDIEQKMRQQNATLHLLKLEYLASEHGVKRAQSSRYPSLALFGEYNFLQSQNAVGILKSNQILGPAVGLSLRYDLFNGFQTNRQIEIAKLEREKQALRKEKLDR